MPKALMLIRFLWATPAATMKRTASCWGTPYSRSQQNARYRQRTDGEAVANQEQEGSLGAGHTAEHQTVKATGALGARGVLIA